MLSRSIGVWTGLLIAACAVTGEWTGFSERSRNGEERPTPAPRPPWHMTEPSRLTLSLPRSLTHSRVSDLLGGPRCHRPTHPTTPPLSLFWDEMGTALLKMFIGIAY